MCTKRVPKRTLTEVISRCHRLIGAGIADSSGEGRDVCAEEGKSSGGAGGALAAAAGLVLSLLPPAGDAGSEPGPGSGAAKPLGNAGSKESGDGKTASNPLGLFLNCGNNLFTDAHSLDGCAVWLLASQTLFFQKSSATVLGFTEQKAAWKSCV